MSEFQKEELSLEETNKLRISLGLKPLVADDAPAPASGSGATSAPKLDGDALAAKNFQDKQERERREREDEDVKERLAKAQAKRDAARRLKGPTLGDLDATASASASTSKDTLAWLKESKKRAKEHAARRAKELEEQEARQQAQYRESDLAGLRVGHDADEFGEGEERILTLRDAGVLDGADDELMDAALDQAQRDAKNIERKKGAKQYTGLDEEEALTGKKAGVLSKYDADLPDGGIASAEDAGFRLGANLSAADRQAQLRQEAEHAARLANKQLLSLDYEKNQEVSDYLQEGDVGFKKPKIKKRKKAAKVKISFDDDDETAEPGSSAATATATASKPDDLPDVDMQDANASTRSRQQTDNFVDDDELQASLAKSRRMKAKRTFNKMTPEMIAKNLAAQRAAEEAERRSGTATPGVANGSAAANGDAGRDGGGLTFDETSEFVRAIRERPAQSEEPRRQRSVKRESVEGELDAHADVKREGSVDALAADVPMSELDTTAVKTEADDDVDLGQIKDELEEGEALDPVKVETEASAAEADEHEPVIGRGMAGTLSFLRQQGMLPQADPSLASREQQQRQYDAWLSARRLEEQSRELARQASKASGSSLDQATREAANRNRELDEARLAQDRFRDYKPDVEIKYHDEFGRDLDQKEAWKHLSHVFHGKKPGTKKQEKRLRKIEEEQKRERMAAGDTPMGMGKAFRERSERMGKSGMVLSVGSRGAVPLENDLLGGEGEMKLSKTKGKETSGKARKKVDGGELVGVLSEGASVVASGDASGSASVTQGGGGWARIGSATPAPAGNGASTAEVSGASAGFKPVSAAGFTSISRDSPAAGEGGADAAGRANTPSSVPFRLAFSEVKRKAEGQ
ncbi:hypothetical protein PHSY_002213 [Pseudozyma hubeiensis SY62]|uniref:SART-1 protein n=1 Tax=Pseudozyma hubeiensis (strain SY62) TaxID=1305764 RepID=R9P963_PSEHS|nr:hypothetical protein PHSY_002213 [Pseudozyma hubeiensis SY62]GAC94640.1 hypothetical protein PHSY_002213 [Pseudozyma hubeiensis SY62]